MASSLLIYSSLLPWFWFFWVLRCRCSGALELNRGVATLNHGLHQVSVALPFPLLLQDFVVFSFFLDQRKNCIISKLSTSSRYTQHSQSTHALSSSKSQSQTCVKNQIEGHTGIHSASRLRTSAQRTATNIPVGWNEHNLLLPSCVFLLPLSATDEEERLILIYPIQDWLTSVWRTDLFSQALHRGWI